MKCPACGSEKLQKAGRVWVSKTKQVQQYRCAECRSRTTKPVEE